MGELKAITGHTRARRLQAYLERGGRALARDFINLAPPLAGEDAVFVNKEIDISLCRFSTLRWQAPTHLPS